MTTYLGEKAVGIGTIKATSSVSDVLHDNTLTGNGNTEPLGVNTEVIATKEGLESKQDKLTAGENITIEDGVISATGGGVSLPDLGEEKAAFLRKNYQNELFWDTTSFAPEQSSKANGVSIGRFASSSAGQYSTSLNGTATGESALALGYGAKSTAKRAIMIGRGTNDEPYTLKVGFDEFVNTGYKLLDSDGTIPLERLTKVTDQIGDISTALTAILGE